MSTSTTGAGDNMAQHLLGEIIAGGITIHLLGGGDTMSYTDGSTEVSNKSDASADVAEADVTINAAGGFGGTATLTNDNQVSFGSQSIGTVDEIVIQNQNNTDRWVVLDETNDPNLTGEDVNISANTTLYEFGNP